MRTKLLRLLVGTLAVLVVAALAAHLARPRVQVGGPAHDANRPALGAVDHASFDRLLRNYVDNQGLVAYARWKSTADDLRALDDYLKLLGAADLEKPASPSERLAFWINAYNALTLKGILDRYPTRSIRQHTPLVGGFNIWRDLLLWVDGNRYSLDDIEHRILRKLGEPRIHFAVVCAARGCPPLRNQAYSAHELEQQLNDNARRFFAHTDNLLIDRASRTIFISELFKWYGSDFADSPEKQMRALRPYFPRPETLGWLDTSPITVEYLSYDWDLNEQP